MVLALASFVLLWLVEEMLWLVLPDFVPQDVSLDVAVAIEPSCAVSRGSDLLPAAIHSLLAGKLQILSDGTVLLVVVVPNIQSSPRQDALGTHLLDHDLVSRQLYFISGVNGIEFPVTASESEVLLLARAFALALGDKRSLDDIIDGLYLGQADLLQIYHISGSFKIGFSA